MKKYLGLISLISTVLLVVLVSGFPIHLGLLSSIFLAHWVLLIFIIAIIAISGLLLARDSKFSRITSISSLVILGLFLISAFLVSSSIH